MIVLVMAFWNLVLAQQIYSEETKGGMRITVIASL